MDPKVAYRGIAIGTNCVIQPKHAWCFLFGDNLTSRGHYDVQIGDSISVLASLRPGDLDLRLKATYEIFRQHSIEGTFVEGETPGHGVKWLQEVATAIAKIMMTLGKLNKCPVKGCSKQPILTCSACNQARYCSEGCQKEDWKLHRQFCAPRFEVRSRVIDDFYQSLVSLEQQGVHWTPPTLLDKAVYCTKKIFKGELIGYFKGKYKTLEELGAVVLQENETLDDQRWSWAAKDGRVFLPSKKDPLTLAADPAFTTKSQRNFLQVFSTSQNCITSLGDLKNIIPYGSASPINAVVAEAAGNVGLVATRNIAVGEEIFFHRGFSYHFNRECQRGFIFDRSIEELPANIYSSPGFREYVIFYYPYATDLFVTAGQNNTFQIGVCINESQKEERDPIRVFFGPLQPPLGTTRVAKMAFDDYRTIFYSPESQ